MASSASFIILSSWNSEFSQCLGEGVMNIATVTERCHIQIPCLMPGPVSLFTDPATSIGFLLLPFPPRADTPGFTVMAFSSTPESWTEVGKSSRMFNPARSGLSPSFRSLVSDPAPTSGRPITSLRAGEASHSIRKRCTRHSDLSGVNHYFLTDGCRKQR